MNTTLHSSLILMLAGFLLAPLLVSTGCKTQEEESKNRKMIGDPVQQLSLPKQLKEISGLATSVDGRLFAHDDESGIVYELDPFTGSILKSFRLGRSRVTEDFEGIAIAGERFFLVTSGGDVYEFPEGPDGARVEYRIHKTPLSKANDVEGLCYDPDTETLLLACKSDPGPGLKKARAVYAFSLRTHSLIPEARFVLARKDIEKHARGGAFRPSGIARHPLSGNFFIVAAQGESLLELAPDGSILSQVVLSKKNHPQSEGLTFLPNGDMLISDEGNRHGRLSRYAYDEY